MKNLKEALRFLCSSNFLRMALLWGIALLFSYFQLLKRRIFDSKSNPSSSSNRSSNNTQSSPICVITGATSGIGKATAFALSKKGFYVVLVGRSSQLLSKTLNEIKKQNENAQVKAFEVDISSFQSVLKFKNSLEQWLLEEPDLHSSIQLLVNNAGILTTSSKPTIDGFDRMIATNYIGAFSLTKLLLPLLKNSHVPSRIVNVTSFTHRSVFTARFDKDSVTGTGLIFSRTKHYPFAKIYEYSKLCLLVFSYELHKQLRFTDDSNHVSVVAVDPGAVKTNIMREIPLYIQVLAFCCLKVFGLMQSSEDAAETIVDAALAPFEVSGKYFFGGNGRTIESSAISRDQKLAKELWDTSCLIFDELHQTLHLKD